MRETCTVRFQILARPVGFEIERRKLNITQGEDMETL